MSLSSYFGIKISVSKKEINNPVRKRISKMEGTEKNDE